MSKKQMAVRLCGESGQLNSAGKPCSGRAMPNGKCYSHGGPTPSGIASPNYRHGLRSNPRNLPAHMAASYHASRNDPELLSLREEIAATDARIDDLWNRVAQETPMQTYESLLAAYREAEKQRKNAQHPDEEKRAAYWQAYETMGLLLMGACDDLAIRREIRQEESHRANLAMVERSRLKDLGAMVTSEKAINFVAGVLGILRRHVLAMMEPKAARKLLMAVQDDVRALMGRGESVEVVD